MLTGWWRSRHVRALARNRPGTSSPAGHPRAGLGASGSRKCASSAAAPTGSRSAVSSTMIRACCHEIVPDCRAPKVSGSAVVNAWQSDRKAPAERSLTVRTHAISATTAISRAVCSCGDTAGGANAVAARTYSAASRTFNAAFRASSRATSASPSRQASAKSRNGSSRRGPASRDRSRPDGSERSGPGPVKAASAAADAATAATASLLSALHAAVLSMPLSNQDAPTVLIRHVGLQHDSARPGRNPQETGTDLGGWPRMCGSAARIGPQGKSGGDDRGRSIGSLMPDLEGRRAPTTSSTRCDHSVQFSSAQFRSVERVGDVEVGRTPWMQAGINGPAFLWTAGSFEAGSRHCGSAPNETECRGDRSEGQEQAETQGHEVVGRRPGHPIGVVDEGHH